MVEHQSPCLHPLTTLDLGAGPADQERDTGALRVQQNQKVHTTCECCSGSGLFGSGIDNVQLCAKSSGMMRSKLEQKIHGFKEDVKVEQTD